MAKHVIEAFSSDDIFRNNTRSVRRHVPRKMQHKLAVQL